MASSELLSVGQQCSAKHCYLVDFLPFKCQHCSQNYCYEHFRPVAHNCEKYDETKHDRVAPSCPICNQPVAIPPNEDPNIRMTRHIETECGRGRDEVSKVPRCANGKCHKVLYSPIKCDTCRQQFCAEHRFPSAHKCVTGISLKQTSALQEASSNSKVGTKLKSALDTGSARTSAGMAAMKRAVATTANSQSESKQGQKSTGAQTSTDANTKTSHSNPFSKTDRWVVKPLNATSSHTNPVFPSRSSLSVTNAASSDYVQFESQSQSQTCKSDVSTKLTTTATSYHPPPLFAF